MKGMRFAFLMLLVGAGAAGLEPARASDVITGTSTTDPALRWGNGNKMEIGLSNHLHAVYSDGYQIQYITSTNGDAWTAPVTLSSGDYIADHAAIAVSGSRMAAVWWEDDYTPQGKLVYAHRTLPGAWSGPVDLVAQGQEPAIALRGARAHIVWKTHTPGSDSSVQYRLLDPFSSPPSFPWSFGQLVEQTLCPGTYYAKPAIALVRKICYPDVPKVAYLEAADEQGGGPCVSPQTRVGPRVESLDAGVWTPVTSYLHTSTAADVGPVSLSLSSHYKNGLLYLAWSDDAGGSARTALAHGKTVWPAAPASIESDRNHVHVRANNNSWAGSGQFRLSYAFEESFDWDARTRTGTGLDGSPAVIGGASLLGNSQPDRLPQSQWWRSCSLAGCGFLNNYFEEETPNPVSPPNLVTNYFFTMLTPVLGPPVFETLCPDRHAAVKMAGLMVDGAEATAVDLAELGTLTKISDTGAEITTFDRKTVSATWTGGRVVQWDNESFTVSTPRNNLRFSSRDAVFEVEDLGYIKDYDGLR